MDSVVKLNYNRKVRYIFDRPGEDYKRLSELVVDHYSSFINHSWTMDDVKKFDKIVRTCGMSVNEFLDRDWSDKKVKKA